LVFVNDNTELEKPSAELRFLPKYCRKLHKKRYEDRFFRKKSFLRKKTSLHPVLLGECVLPLKIPKG